MSSDENRHEFAGRPLISSPLTEAELDWRGGPAFWIEVERVTAASGLAEHMDTAINEQSVPRVWAVLDEPAGKPGVVAAALSLARGLAAREQAVMVVDADDLHPDLTRWSGRFELEGWIDLIRYGASVLTSSADLRFAGKKSVLMGVGSFCPTQVTEEEIAEFLGRIRRQTDDLLLLLPADQRALPWIQHADIRILCWDRLVRSSEETADLIARLEGWGASPTALIGFGTDLDAELSAGATAASASGADFATTSIAAEEARETEYETADDGPVLAVDAAEAEAEGRDEPDEAAAKKVSEAGIAAAEAADSAVARRSVVTSPRRTSGLFWGLAALFLVVIAAGIGYYVKVIRPPLGTATETVARGADIVARPLGDTQANPKDGDLGGAEASSPGKGDEGAVATPSAGPADMASAEGNLAGERAADELAANDLAADKLAAGDLVAAVPRQEIAAAADSLAAPAESNVSAPPAASAAPQEAPPAELTKDQTAAWEQLDGARFTGPVGQEGWALWLYSLPDSASAKVEIRELQRRGLRAAYRTVDLEARGVWYRVFVGSFPHRRAAAEAVKPLRIVLRHDWIVPARF